MSRPKSETIRKSVGIRLNPELVKRLKMLAIKSDRQLNLLLEEAILDLLKKNKEKP